MFLDSGFRWLQVGVTVLSPGAFSHHVDKRESRVDTVDVRLPQVPQNGGLPIPEDQENYTALGHTGNSSETSYSRDAQR